MPRLFAISDLHFPGGTNKIMDPFGTEWVNHVQKIEENWHRIVGEEDIVLIPGDISWAMKLSEVQEDLKRISIWPGTKVLIRGNHDYWWQGIGKVRKILSPQIFALQNDCFSLDKWAICGTRGWKIPGDEVFTQKDEKIYQRELVRLELSLKARGQPKETIVMLHYPPFNEKKEPSGFVSLMKRYGVATCVYGHLHGQGGHEAITGLVDGISYYLVACDQLDFEPKLIGNIR